MVTLGQGLGLAMSLLSWVGGETFQDYEIFMPDLMFSHLKGHLPLLLGPPCLGSRTTLCFDKLTAALGRL